jgi:hypothetical protein
MMVVSDVGNYIHGKNEFGATPSGNCMAYLYVASDTNVDITKLTYTGNGNVALIGKSDDEYPYPLLTFE